jgi:hypothetical protein
MALAVDTPYREQAAHSPVHSKADRCSTYIDRRKTLTPLWQTRLPRPPVFVFDLFHRLPFVSNKGSACRHNQSAPTLAHHSPAPSYGITHVCFNIRQISREF